MNKNHVANVRVLNGEDIGNPETLAMLQAFYSRSPMAIDERLRSLDDGTTTLNEGKVKAALKRYYFDYGHASIADCGGATVFIENVSMLAAKVFQDDPLYNGQECSTRYIDFSSQPFLTAYYTQEEQIIQDEWRRLYLAYLPKLVEWAKAKYSVDYLVSHRIADDKKQQTWETTCKAIAFDVARGLLPCGASTSLAWTGTLRRLRERLEEMVCHPLREVRITAAKVYRMLYDRHPNSFAEELEVHDYNYAGNSPYLTHFYNVLSDPFSFAERPKVFSTWRTSRNDDYTSLFIANTKGAPKALLRKAADTLFYYQIKGGIDFGSFRDLQRHRNGLNRLPLVGNASLPVVMNSFYTEILTEVDPDLYSDVRENVIRCVRTDLSPIDRQYVLPMMTNVDTELHWNLGQVRYVLELRTKTSIHPTLRSWMLKLPKEIEAATPEVTGMLKVDTRGNYETSDRGNQTLKEKDA